jgi:hypothetical protein
MVKVHVQLEVFELDFVVLHVHLQHQPNDLLKLMQPFLLE